MTNHCDTILGNDELSVPNVSQATVSTVHATTGVGSRRGVVVLAHGLQVQPNPTIPFPINNTGTVGFLSDYLTFANDLAGDGWEVIQPLYQEDLYNGPCAQGIYNDVANDPGFGARYLASTLEWWDHVVTYVHNTYGPNWPITIHGFSEGAWKSLVVAIHKTSTLAAYSVHCPLTHWANVNNAYTPGSNFGLLNWKGMAIGATDLNAVAIPGGIGWGTSDTAVGFEGTSTVAAGSNGTVMNGTNFSGTQSLSVALSTTFGGTGPKIVTIVGTGGVVKGTMSYGGTGTGTLTNCQWISGSGTLATGDTVVQNGISQLATNAQGAGMPVTTSGLTGTDTHEFTTTDAANYFAWYQSAGGPDSLCPKVL
jgi:hypothetical protein